MPYYVFNIEENPNTNTKKVEHLETFEVYKDAKILARKGRSEISEATKDCRLIFAHTEAEAAKLLSAPKEKRHIGED